MTVKNRKGIKNNFFYDKKWLIDTPKSIRLNAVKEATKNWKSGCTNVRNGNIKFFDLRTKTKKHEKANGWCMGLEKVNVKKIDNELRIFPKTLGKMKYGKGKKGNKSNQLNKLIISDKPQKDCKLQKDKFGDYYLVLTIEKVLHSSKL